jgi:ABC-2 type transport system ATP-binding protein
MECIIKTNNLTKVFKDKIAVEKVNMHIKKGEIYGFLGPNGAGKTTVMRLLTNLIKPTSGEIEVFGEKLTNTSYEVFKRMGTIIEIPIFYDKLTARENLELHCEYMGYHDKKAIERALDLVSLEETNKKAVKDFSLGMKQRLGIARAITTKPELLILDEPINGLDPIGIKEIRGLLKILSKEYGMTLLISSHILGEMELIADTIGVINNGRLLQEISMDSIRENNTDYIEITTKECSKAVYLLENNMSVSNFKVFDNSIIRIYESKLPQNEIIKTLVLNNISIEAITKKNGSLEDYFIGLLKGGSADA